MYEYIKIVTYPDVMALLFWLYSDAIQSTYRHYMMMHFQAMLSLTR